VLDRADLLVLPTDDAARFCVRLSLPIDRYVAHLEARASGLVDGAKLDLPVDLALLPVTLRFDPEPAAVSLDEDTAAFDVVASTEEDGVTTAAAGLPLTLTNETGALLGTATTDGTGRTRFAITGASAKLGAPGKGELRVAFAGSADAGASVHTQQIERRTRVDLVAPDAIAEPSAGMLPIASPEDGIGVRLVATPRCAKLGCAGAPTGTVEARIAEGAGDVIAGAAALEKGEAHVVVTFAMPAASEVQLRARYVADAPWFEPGAELVLRQPVRASSPWRKVPLVLAGFAAMAWLVLARMPARARAGAHPGGARGASRPLPGGPEGPRVELVRPGDASQGWVGRLVDAHDAIAVAGARVSVERRGFGGIDVVAQTTSDDAGAFRLAPFDANTGDELVAEGPLHAPIRRPLPPAGELRVALVLRRRALLERLVDWARRRGRPYDAKPDPTPGHVRRAAGPEFSIARWADAVERAAYGGGAVDERAQAEVDRLAPAEAAERGAEPGAQPGAQARQADAPRHAQTSGRPGAGPR
jgi:hypothetical protein